MQQGYILHNQLACLEALTGRNETLQPQRHNKTQTNKTKTTVGHNKNWPLRMQKPPGWQRYTHLPRLPLPPTNHQPLPRHQALYC